MVGKGGVIVPHSAKIYGEVEAPQPKFAGEVVVLCNLLRAIV